MAYLPKSEAERNIKKRVRKNQDGTNRIDYEVYLGVDVFTGKPVRMTRNDLKTLKTDIAMFYSRLRCGGDAAVMLTADEAVDARHALKIIESLKIRKSITEIIRDYASGRSRGDDGLVIDENMKIEDAFRTYYQGKSDGVNKDFIKKCTGKWVEQNLGRKLTSFTAEEIKRYLDDNFAHMKPRTYNANLNYIKIFLNWCASDVRKFIARNPAKHIEPRPEPWTEPKYMKPGDVRNLFMLLESHKGVRPDMLAYAITSFFCGARSVEITRIAEGESAVTVNIEDETMRIAKGKGFQYGRKPRAFHIGPTALAWMKSFDYADAVKRIDKKTMVDIYDLAKKHSIPIFRNCGRHSFITYHVAAYGDPAKTQAIVGTSEKMRAENYCGLASRADAVEYFKILPNPSVKEADPGELRRIHIGKHYAKVKAKKLYMFDKGYKPAVKHNVKPAAEAESGIEVEVA